ncbi:uncharacterized protein N0V89_008229 [Didymosphaeria variabile]|uniref:Peptidase M12A domain-containing protein n=1 Tax=Didymosphaeria variabile TaxID=1932322 RepID=A0A9W9C8N0_9PLEO|nr:uncharacterized protein N0V89_008229 [Didymosphaeria variabile]KAJ4349613.1 hypothetical protein N0V89_008229 [Didymosphaeria variabile]
MIMRLFAVLATYIVAVQPVSAAASYFGRPVPGSRAGKNYSNASVNSNDPQKRYAEFITSGATADHPVTAWPFRLGIHDVNKGYLRRIPYCFVDKRSYEKIGEPCKFINAIEIWKDGLGGKASREDFHSLVIKGPENPEDYCCTKYEYGPENRLLEDGDLHCEWNEEKYPKDALAIHWLDDIKLNGRAAQAQLGYTAEEHNAEAGRHWMHVGDVATAGNIAHELGHVLDGLQTDRPGLSEHDALDMLCTDRELAVEYGSPSSEYVKGDGLDPKKEPIFDGPGGFDVHSIMMYPSMANSHGTENHAHLDDAVLIKIKKDETGKKVPADDWRILPPTRITQQDATFVRRFYAWDERKAREYHDTKREEEISEGERAR